MYTDTTGDSLLEQSVVQRLTETWSDRVAVRRARPDLSGHYDPTIPDFPVAMVPFWAEPAVAQADEVLQLRLLAGAWIAYNEKTIFVEDDVINPLCRVLLRGELPGVSDPRVKQVVAQTAVDEQFHILMCLEVCSHARRRHRLESLELPKPLLLRRLEEALSQARDDGERALARMAFATVAEMSINAYLRALSSDPTIQPLNRINTALHRADEASHSAIFRELGLSVFRNSKTDGREIFKKYIVRALNDFTAPDYSSWTALLSHLEVPGAAAMVDAQVQRTRGRRSPREYAALHAFLDELGIAKDIAFEFV